jgi:hypothetical protein
MTRLSFDFEIGLLIVIGLDGDGIDYRAFR